ncbi:hypothetical protein [Sphingobium nicotianae]|uniref:Lipoprotein n=1 Tax=Sphingobium nicotianae TaxID=2782607 RepID=A0A9X1ISL6_9SPHN|nr:hypothetical protein [Sphingobium nicotianae]MBT2188340.1 hypothetical protein [Sphingobium nicotianae]
MRRILIALTLAALGACNSTDKGGGAANNAAVETDAAGNARNYVAEVTALPQDRRNAVFFRAIRDAGLSCQEVRQAEQIEAVKNTVTWRATCEDGISHLVQMKPDGNAIVISPVSK